MFHELLNVGVWLMILVIGMFGSSVAAEEAGDTEPVAAVEDTGPPAIVVDPEMIDAVVLFALGLHPDWQESYCETINMREDLCRAKQEKGYATAVLWAPILVQEAARAGLGEDGAFWLAAVAMKENSLAIGDQCIINITKSRLASMEELDASPAGERRVRLCVSWDSGRRSCRSAIVLEEQDETIRVNYCMAGEIGPFQLTRYEASAGDVIPATGEALPRAYQERREILMDPAVNTSLAAAAIARLQNHCCSETFHYEGTTLEACHENWDLWIGAYNCGRCDTSTSRSYGARIRAYYERGMAHVCREMPELNLCTPAETPENSGEEEETAPLTESTQ